MVTPCSCPCGTCPELTEDGAVCIACTHGFHSGDDEYGAPA